MSNSIFTTGVNDKSRHTPDYFSVNNMNSVNGSIKSLHNKIPSQKNIQKIDYKGNGEVIFSSKNPNNDYMCPFEEKFMGKDLQQGQLDSNWRKSPDMRKYVDLEDQILRKELRSELGKVKESSEWKQYEWSKKGKKKSNCSIENSKNFDMISTEFPPHPKENQKSVNFRDFVKDKSLYESVTLEKKKFKKADDIMKSIEYERKQFKIEHTKDRHVTDTDYKSTLQKRVHDLKPNEIYQKEQFKVKKGFHKRCFSENFKLGPEDIEDMVITKSRIKTVCSKNLYEQLSKKKFMRYDHDADPKLQNDKKVEDHYTAMYFENRHRQYEKQKIPKEKYVMFDPDLSSPQVKDYVKINREHKSNLLSKEKCQINIKEMDKAMGQLLHKVDDEAQQSGSIKLKLGHPGNWPERTKFYADIKRNCYNGQILEHNTTECNFSKILAQKDETKFERKNIKYDLSKSMDAFQTANSFFKSNPLRNLAVKTREKNHTLNTESNYFRTQNSPWKRTTKYPIGLFEKNPLGKKSDLLLNKSNSFSQITSTFHNTPNYKTKINSQMSGDNKKLSEKNSLVNQNDTVFVNSRRNSIENLEECKINVIVDEENMEDEKKQTLALQKMAKKRNTETKSTAINEFDTVNINSQNDKTILANTFFDILIKANPDYYKRYKELTKKSVNQIRNEVEGSKPDSQEAGTGSAYEILKSKKGLGENDNNSIASSNSLTNLRKIIINKQKPSIPYEEKHEWKVRDRNKSNAFHSYACNVIDSKSKLDSGSFYQINNFKCIKSSGLFQK